MKGWLILPSKLISDLTCSCCRFRTTSAFFMLFRANGVLRVRPRSSTTRTLPSAPVPTVLPMSKWSAPSDLCEHAACSSSAASAIACVRLSPPPCSLPLLGSREPCRDEELPPSSSSDELSDSKCQPRLAGQCSSHLCWSSGSQGCQPLPSLPLPFWKPLPFSQPFTSLPLAWAAGPGGAAGGPLPLPLASPLPLPFGRGGALPLPFGLAWASEPGSGVLLAAVQVWASLGAAGWSEPPDAPLETVDRRSRSDSQQAPWPAASKLGGLREGSSSLDRSAAER
mmetsp:Transcript_68603/g.182275  ORF Transcript_68603/g.182275 Transcript_68603/m.182275 type:complete len:282 (+) Transcript_68603:925-1770(+)